MKKYFVLLLLVGTTQVSIAQIRTKKYLDVGDRMPNLPLSKTVNYHGSEKSVADFKGRLLILDFWATWCGPCIGSFPKNDSLKKEFAGKMVMLPITYEDGPKALDVLTKMARDKKIAVPASVVGDKNFTGLFNFRSIPHYVWIDKDGTIIAQTNNTEVGRKNIMNALNGNASGIYQKERMVKHRDMKTPLFQNALILKEGDSAIYELQPLNDIVFSSILTKQVKGLGAVAVENGNRFVITNGSVISIFRHIASRLMMKTVYEFPMFLVPNRVRYEVSDKIDKEIQRQSFRGMTSLEKDQWNEKYKYCYQMIVPDSFSLKQKAALAFDDLNRKLGTIYGIKASIEKRKVKCLILERTSDIDKLTGSLIPKIEQDKYSLAISNTRFDYFYVNMAALYLQSIPTPIVNETGFDGSKLVTMQLSGKLNSIEGVCEAIAKYDLTFREDYREIDMLVIRDLN